MIELHEEYLVDEQGNRRAVVIPLDAWRQLQEEIEELDDIRAYDAAKTLPSDRVEFDTALAEIARESAD